MVYNTELLGFFGRHEEITVECFLNRVIFLARMLDVDFIKALFHGDNIFSVTLNVRRLPTETARGLVYHDPCIRQGDAHARLTG